MTEMFSKWMNETMHHARTRIMYQAAKSRFFWNGDRKIPTTNADQSMFSHVFNAATTAHALVDCMNLVENDVLKERDELILYYIITIHDMHKFEKDRDHHIMYGQAASLEEYERFARECGIEVAREELIRMVVCIQQHHKNEFSTELLRKYPNITRPKKDPLYYILRISDAIASQSSVMGVFRALLDGLSDMEVHVPGVGDIRKFFIYHIIPQFDGDFSLLLHKSIEREVHDDITPIIFMEDGTVYFSSSYYKFDEDLYDRITDRLLEELGDEIISFKSQAIGIYPTTGEYEKKFPMAFSWNMFVKKMRNYIARSRDKLVDRYVLDEMLQKKGKFREALKDKMGKHPEFADRFNELQMSHEKYAVYYFIRMVDQMLDAYNIDTLNDETLVEFLGVEVDPDIIALMDILDSGGSRQSMWVYMYTFPICSAIYDHLHEPSMDLEEWISAINTFFLSRLDEKYPEWRTTRLGERGLREKISEVIKETVGFQSHPHPHPDEMFGLQSYTRLLEDDMTRKSTKVDTICFLCNNTRNLMKVKRDTVQMSLQIATDRGRSGGSISASNIKRICSKCWLRYTIRKMIYPSHGEGTFYMVVKPDYLFTRDHYDMLTAGMGGILTLSKKNYKKWKKLDENEREEVMEEGITIAPSIVSNIVLGLVHHASLNDHEYDDMGRYLIEFTDKIMSTKWLNDEKEKDAHTWNMFSDMHHDTLLHRFEGQNGFVLPLTFYDGKTESDTSRWFASALLAMYIHQLTGCRVSVTQSYGNIPVIDSNRAVTLDNPPVGVQKIFGSAAELADQDFQRKMVIGTLLWYLNRRYHAEEKERDNTISQIITEHINHPRKMIDLAYRYTKKNKDKNDKELEYEFYRIVNIVNFLTTSS